MISDLDSGMLVTAMIPNALMDFLDESNVEEVIERLSEKHRPFVLEWAHGALFSPASELIDIFGITKMGPVRPEDLHHPREALALAAFRVWFERHHWPDESTAEQGR
jgi:hypothetical protein